MDEPKSKKPNRKTDRLKRIKDAGFTGLRWEPIPKVKIKAPRPFEVRTFLDNLGFSAQEREIIYFDLLCGNEQAWEDTLLVLKDSTILENSRVYRTTLKRLQAKQSFVRLFDLKPAVSPRSGLELPCEFQYSLKPFFAMFESAAAAEEERFEREAEEAVLEKEREATKKAEDQGLVLPPEIRQDMKFATTTFKVSPEQLADPDLQDGALAVIAQFSKISLWFGKEDAVSTAWYSRLNACTTPLVELETDKELVEIRDVIWTKLAEMREMLAQKPEDARLNLRQFSTIVSWFVDRASLKNVNHALGDSTLWGNALSLWHDLGCSIDEMADLNTYINCLFTVCRERKIRLAREALITLGKDYRDKVIAKNDPKVQWLSELHERGTDVEGMRPTKVKDEGEFFQAWCGIKIDKLRAAGFKNIYPTNFTSFGYDPDDDDLAALTSGSAPVDKWAEIRSFLGLSAGCVIHALPRGWKPSKGHPRDVTEIVGTTYRLKEAGREVQYGSICHHSSVYTGPGHPRISGVDIMIKVTPENFFKYKASWNDKTLHDVPPTLAEMLADGVFGKDVDPVTGQWIGLAARLGRPQVNWSDPKLESTSDSTSSQNSINSSR